jgi:hypothetical protein
MKGKSRAWRSDALRDARVEKLGGELLSIGFAFWLQRWSPRLFLMALLFRLI